VWRGWIEFGTEIALWVYVRSFSSANLENRSVICDSAIVVGSMPIHIKCAVKSRSFFRRAES